MRFDGYYMLSDFWDVPNLQQRAFTLGKWYLRKLLLGLEAPCPEPFSTKKRRQLIVYAYATWIYRLVLFTGIAIMIYHLFFKVLGIFLFVAEMGYFVAMPIYLELKNWWQQRAVVGWNSRLLTTLLVVVLLTGLLAVPWDSRIRAPALLKPEAHARIYPPFSARIEKMLVSDGRRVKKGERLFILKSPRLEHHERQAETEVKVLEAQLRRQISSHDLMEKGRVIQRQLAEALSRLQGIREQRERLGIRAPIDGVVMDMADGLRPGQWVNGDLLLTVVVDRRGVIIEGFLEEEDLESVRVGSAGRFYMENRDTDPVDCRVTEIDETSSRNLKEPYLASVYGGDIPVEMENGQKLISRKSLCRITLIPVNRMEPPYQIVCGSVLIKGRPQSLLSRAWRRVQAVLIRESGF